MFLVEIVSGILQGYSVPLISYLVKYLHIRDADFNWFEAAQLLLSAPVVPILAKLGDMFGHTCILLVSPVLTAGASWALVLADSFTTFLIAWALQGFYVVWLPLEVALIFDRGRGMGRGASQTRRAAGFLVVALEAGAIIGALLGGRVFGWFGNSVPPTLTIAAIAVTLVFLAVLFGVPESTPLPGRRLDVVGFSMLTLGLLLITSGLTLLRLNGLDAWWVYIVIVLGPVGAMPAAVAAAAPRGQTGIAAALTNTIKTTGGSFASATIGIVLAMGVLAAATSTASSLSGYLTVWIMCGIGALVAAVLLFFVPKLAFADVADGLPAGVETAPIE